MTEMSDAQFVSYMDMHSRTERALFHKDHINRLLALAGEEPDEVHEWQAWHYHDMKPILDKVRSRLEAETKAAPKPFDDDHRYCHNCRRERDECGHSAIEVMLNAKTGRKDNEGVTVLDCPWHQVK